MASKKDRDTPTININATVIDGTIRLQGDGLVGDTIEVVSGQDVIVSIVDTEGHYLYAVEIPSGGASSACWSRDSGIVTRKFTAVSTTINNITLAVGTRDSASVTYGPVIKLEPKG